MISKIKSIIKQSDLTKFFKEIGRVDELGSGVKKLFKYCKVYSARNKNGWGRFIREKIERKPEITINEMAKQIGITEKGIEWQIKKLKKAKQLKRIGKSGWVNLEL